MERELEGLNFFKTKTKIKKNFKKNDVFFVLFFVLEPFILIGLIGYVFINKFNNENKNGIQITARDTILFSSKKIQEFSLENQNNNNLNTINMVK